jgi:hypothetical protein
MKKLSFLFLFIVFGFSFTIVAQPRFDIKEQVKELKSELKLTDKQSDSIKVVLEEMRDSMSKMRDESQDDWSGMREKMGALREKTNTQIEKYLNEEQVVKFRKLMEERDKERQKRFGNR